jgi:hypothetical protein
VNDERIKPQSNRSQIREFINYQDIKRLGALTTADFTMIAPGGDPE